QQEFELPGQKKDEPAPAAGRRPTQEVRAPAAAPPPPRRVTQQVPAPAQPPPQQAPQAPGPPPQRRPTVEAQTGFDTGGPRRQTRDSVFAVNELEDISKVEIILQGKVRPMAPPVVKPPPPTQAMKAFGARYAQETAAEVKVTGRQLVPLAAPIQSEVGARHPVLTANVIDQFRPGENPRYQKGERGHLFIWDVTTAMGIPIPLYKGAGRLSLDEVVSWFRSLANGRGWVRISTARAVELSNKGYPVVALPRGNVEPRIAMCRPGGAGRDGGPLLATACKAKRGGALGTVEALGVKHAEYHFHP
ncbi:MAG: hypothetical protein RL653_1051, partial [Pseudomonadota bacterium]